MPGLTPKEKKFCELYDLYRNGARAAFEAGYSKDKKAARYRARDLLKEPEVQKYLSELEEQARYRLNITKYAILRELKAIAFSDMRNYVKWNDQIAYLADSGELKASQAKAVAEIRNDHTGGGDDGQAKGIVKIKLHDKVSALEKLGKHLGLFKDETDVNHKGNITVTVKRLTAKK